MKQMPVGIFYEHPKWFKKLFAIMDQRGMNYQKIHAAYHAFNPADSEPPFNVSTLLM